MVAGQPNQQVEHGIAAGGIEAAGRFVEQQGGRIVDEGLGEFEPLLHAGRVFFEAAITRFIEPDAALRSTYDTLYRDYLDLYQDSRRVVHRLASRQAAR